MTPESASGRSGWLRHVAALWRPLAFALALCASPATTAAQDAGGLPAVRVIGTGGTIASEQYEPGTLGRYEVKKGVNEIVAMVPSAHLYARVEMEQFSNVSSPSITPSHWLKLAQHINALLNERSDLSGVVVTHGTSRLEETAFFLHLTIRSDRPVVVVGAQRPPTGISPDGPTTFSRRFAWPQHLKHAARACSS